MSELLRQACEEASKGNATIKQQVRDIGTKFLNSVEISAQEAVYILLQLPMKESSREVVFINTNLPEERVKLLKSMNDIKKLEDDSEDIYTTALIKRYTSRPPHLEQCTLADYKEWHDSSKQYGKQSTQIDTDKFPLETDNNDINDDDTEINNNLPHEQILNCKKIKKRLKARIIRSVWFNKEKDSQKHFRELIMLFTSWRNENTDLLGNFPSYEDHFSAVKDISKGQMDQYAVHAQELNIIEKEFDNMKEDDDKFDLIAPVTRDIEHQHEAEGSQDLHPDLNETYNFSEDVGIPSTMTSNNNESLILNELQDEEYRRLIQMLNKEQKEVCYHILHLIKTSDKPFYCFLSGGAWVGKSHLTKAIYQAALKYYNTRAGEDFHTVKVLLLAPTGKAAFNIRGNTIHSALAVPASQSLKKYKPLDASRLNTLRCKLGGLKLILLDEISMVGTAMFNVQINNRLKDIQGSAKDFAGVSIIAIGDLFQLKPVMDGYVFKDINNSEYVVLAPNLWHQILKCLNSKRL